MKIAVTTTEAADRDISDIVAYIATDNSSAARQFGAELLQRFEQICENPDIGKAISGFAAPLRSVRVSNRFWRYRIYYRRMDIETVEVVRILHGARDIGRLLEELRETP